MDKDTKGAKRFREAMLGMSGDTVMKILHTTPTANASGGIFTMQYPDALKSALDILFLRQGFGAIKHEGTLSFQFTLAKVAQVDGFLSIESAIDEVRLSKVRNNDDIRFWARTVSGNELEKLIKYFEDICPKISQAAFPEWHAGRD